MLEKTVRRGLVKVFAMKKIIVDQLRGECLRALFVMQGQVCQAPRVAGQSAFGLAIDRKALAQFYIKVFKARDLRDRGLCNRLTFFYTSY